MRLIYLGSPYSHKSKNMRLVRRKEVGECLAYFAMTAPEIYLFSPIAHWGEVADNNNLPHDFDFWAQRDFFTIRQAHSMWVLDIPGREESYGVRQEIEYAQAIGKPVMLVKLVHEEGIIKYVVEEYDE